MKKVMLLLSVFSLSTLFGMGTISKEDVKRETERRKIISEALQDADSLVRLMQGQARVLFGLGVKDKLQQVDLKNFDLNNESIKRNISDWNSYFNDAKVIVDRSRLQLKCFVDSSGTCKIDDLTVISLRTLNSNIIKFIAALSSMLRNSDVDLGTRYKEYTNILKIFIDRSKKQLNSISKEITKNTLQAEHEAKKVIAGILDIFEQLLKKIETDFKSSVEKMAKNVGPRESEILSQVLSDIDSTYSAIFSNIDLAAPILISKAKIDMWEDLVKRVSFRVRLSTSEKLFNVVKDTSFIRNVAGLPIIINDITREIGGAYAQRERFEKGVLAKKFNGQFDFEMKELKKIKDSINKVWTFYSEPQANAKKVMLHLIAKCEQMLAKAKSDLIKKYPDLGKEPARYASLEEDIKFDLPAYSEPVVVAKRSEKGKKISSRAPAYQPLSLSNDQEDDEEIPLETRGRVGRNLRNMSDEERAKLFGDIE